MLQRTVAPAGSPSARRGSPQGEPKVEKSRLFSTKNNLPETTRARVADLLNQRLADCIDLQSQCKQAHWNVKGRNFIGLHQLFDDINQDVREYVDLIAERVVQLGGIAEGTVRMVAGRTTLAEYPVVSDGEAHVEALSSALSAFAAAARKDLDQIDELGDADTVDILTEISRGTDKWLWFVEAHHQREPEGHR